eukprot:38337-Chlamydomonas_euryale.AAC.10
MAAGNCECGQRQPPAGCCDDVGAADRRSLKTADRTCPHRRRAACSAAETDRIATVCCSQFKAASRTHRQPSAIATQHDGGPSSRAALCRSLARGGRRH